MHNLTSTFYHDHHINSWYIELISNMQQVMQYNCSNSTLLFSIYRSQPIPLPSVNQWMRIHFVCTIIMAWTNKDSSHNFDTVSDATTEIIDGDKSMQINNRIEVMTNTKRVTFSSKVSVGEARHLLYASSYLDKWINCLEKIVAED